MVRETLVMPNHLSGKIWENGLNKAVEPGRRRASRSLTGFHRHCSVFFL
jgi:hypothetical protein